MIQMSVISGHPTSIGFRRLTGCQRDPWDSGVTWGNVMVMLLIIIGILVIYFVSISFSWLYCTNSTG